MKTNVKAILSLILTVMLLASLAVSATSPMSVPTISGPVSGTFTVATTIPVTGGVAKQVTMLVYSGTPSDTTIIGIDQKPSDPSTGAVSFDFGTDATTPIGTYTVLVGGEDVNEAASTTFEITPTPSPTPVPTEVPIPEPTAVPTATPVAGSTVSGVVGPLFENFDYPELNAQAMITAELKTSALAADVLYTATVSVNAIDASKADYSFDGVADGSYVLKLSKPGYMARYVAVNVNGGAVVVDDKELWAGDVNGDGFIDGGDSGLLFNTFDFYIGDSPELYNVTLDFNLDGFVDGGDSGLMFNIFDVTAENYNEPDVDVWS